MRFRPFQGPSDFPAIMALAVQAPVEQFSATALPYQLSSWALDAPANVGLWEDSAGRLLAFALLQIPFASLYYTIHPAADREDALETLLAWAVQRGAALAQTTGQPVTFAITAAGNASHTIARLEAHGFHRQEPPRLLLTRSLAEPLPAPRLPPGFILRHLHGPAEVAAASSLLAAAFQIDSVTPIWRRRILERTEYRPELDVVAESFDGQLAAFCLCWLNPNGQIGQIEPMGVHPDFQRRGLGRATLLEGLHRLQQLGANTAYVGTSAGNARSLPMYQSVGFRLHHEKRCYQQTFPATP